MKKILKKTASAALAASLAFGMSFTGTAGISSVQAAENKAFAAPINFPGVDPEKAAEDYDWDIAGTRLGIDISDAGTFSDQYTFSYNLYIPKAAIVSQPNHTQVQVHTWFDLSVDETYLGNVSSQYSFLIVNDNDEIFPVVVDEQEGQELKSSEYQKFFTMSEAGDFYKLAVKDAPVRNLLNPAEEGQEQTAIDTSQSGNIGMQTRITGSYNTLSSIVYLDDLSLKAGGTVVFETDFSAADMHSHSYEYVLGAEKDENRKERPALADLNTRLLKLSKSSAGIKVGKTVKIQASAAGNGKITYQSSNKKIATVTAKGVVKGVKAGKATITVRANGVSKKFKVTVKK